MEENAKKVVDLLRGEGLTIHIARLTLEHAIQMLEYEPLAPTKEVVVEFEQGSVYGIKEIRKQKSMTQEELAEKSGISRVTISGLENGTERNTTSKTLLKIAAALGVSVDQLLVECE